MGPVTLSPLEPGHADAMFRWTSDPEVADGLGLRNAATREGTEAWIAHALGDDSVHAFAIHAGDEHVGMVVLDRMDRAAATTRLHIYVGEPSARGRGVGRRAVELAVERAFGDYGLRTVWLVVHSTNARAIAAYRRAGFRFVDERREEAVVRGRPVTLLHMVRERTDGT